MKYYERCMYSFNMDESTQDRFGASLTANEGKREVVFPYPITIHPSIHPPCMKQSSAPVSILSPQFPFFFLLQIHFLFFFFFASFTSMFVGLYSIDKSSIIFSLSSHMHDAFSVCITLFISSEPRHP